MNHQPGGSEELRPAGSVGELRSLDAVLQRPRDVEIVELGAGQFEGQFRDDVADSGEPRLLGGDGREPDRLVERQRPAGQRRRRPSPAPALVGGVRSGVLPVHGDPASRQRPFGQLQCHCAAAMPLRPRGRGQFRVDGVPNQCMGEGDDAGSIRHRAEDARRGRLSEQRADRGLGQLGYLAQLRRRHALPENTGGP